jgi:hypothetical protein
MMPDMLQRVSIAHGLTTNVVGKWLTGRGLRACSEL